MNKKIIAETNTNKSMKPFRFCHAFLSVSGKITSDSGITMTNEKIEYANKLIQPITVRLTPPKGSRK